MECIFTGATTPHTSKTNPIPSKQSRPTCAKHRKRACHFDPDTVKYLLRGDVAQLVRALRSHRRGRGFEPLHPHQTKTTHWVVFCLVCVQRGSKGGTANRPVDGLPAPGNAAERLHRAKRKQPEGEVESPSIITKRKPPIGWFLFGLRFTNLKNAFLEDRSKKEVAIIHGNRSETKKSSANPIL